MKLTKTKLRQIIKEELKEANSAVPGEWVVWISYGKRGKKLVKTAKNHRGAKQVLSKLEKQWPDEADEIGMMPLKTWEDEEAKYAIK